MSWWSPMGGTADLEDTEVTLLTPMGDAASDVAQTFLAVHSYGCRALSRVAKRPLPDMAAVRSELAGASTLFDAASSTVSKSLGEVYGPLLVRDLIVTSVRSAEQVYDRLHRAGVSPPLAVERTALVFGVPQERLGGFMKVASAPAVNPTALAYEADKAVMATAEALSQVEARSPVAKQQAQRMFHESDVVRDHLGRFAPEGRKTAPQVRKPRTTRQPRKMRGALLKPKKLSAELPPAPPAPPQQKKLLQPPVVPQQIKSDWHAFASQQKRKVREQDEIAALEAEAAARENTPRASLQAQIRHAEAASRTAQRVEPRWQALSDPVADRGVMMAVPTSVARSVLAEAPETVTLADLGVKEGHVVRANMVGPNVEYSPTVDRGVNLTRAHKGRAESDDALDLGSLMAREADRAGRHGVGDVVELGDASPEAWISRMGDDAAGMVVFVPSRHHPAGRAGDASAPYAMPITNMAKELDPSQADQIVLQFDSEMLVGDARDMTMLPHDARDFDVDYQVAPDRAVRYSYTPAETTYVVNDLGHVTAVLHMRSVFGKAMAPQQFRESDVRRDSSGRFTFEGRRPAPAQREPQVRRPRQPRQQRRARGGLMKLPKQTALLPPAPVPQSTAQAQVHQRRAQHLLQASLLAGALEPSVLTKASENRLRWRAEWAAKQQAIATVEATPTAESGRAAAVDRRLASRDYLFSGADVSTQDILSYLGSVSSDGVFTPSGDMVQKLRNLQYVARGGGNEGTITVNGGSPMLGGPDVPVVTFETRADDYAMQNNVALPRFAAVIAAANSRADLDARMIGMPDSVSDRVLGVERSLEASYDEDAGPSDAELAALEAQGVPDATAGMQREMLVIAVPADGISESDRFVVRQGPASEFVENDVGPDVRDIARSDETLYTILELTHSNDGQE